MLVFIQRHVKSVLQIPKARTTSIWLSQNLEKRNPWNGYPWKRHPCKVTTQICSNRREELSRPRIGIWRWRRSNVLHVEETPHNTAEASIVVSTAHALVETTSSYDDSLARKQYSSQMLMEDWQLLTAPRRLQDWIKCTSQTKLQTRSEGIQNLKHFVDWLWLLHFNKKTLKVLVWRWHMRHIWTFLRTFLWTGFCIQRW